MVLAPSGRVTVRRLTTTRYAYATPTTSRTMRASCSRKSCEVNSSGRQTMNAGSPYLVTVSAARVSTLGE